jgi:hypothetical protein
VEPQRNFDILASLICKGLRGDVESLKRALSENNLSQVLPALMFGTGQVLSVVWLDILQPESMKNLLSHLVRKSKLIACGSLGRKSGDRKQHLPVSYDCTRAFVLALQNPSDLLFGVVGRISLPLQVVFVEYASKVWEALPQSKYNRGRCPTKEHTYNLVGLLIFRCIAN